MTPPQKKTWVRGVKEKFWVPLKLTTTASCSQMASLRNCFTLVVWFLKGARQKKKKKKKRQHLKWNLPQWGSIATSCPQSLNTWASKVPAPYPQRRAFYKAGRGYRRQRVHLGHYDLRLRTKTEPENS